jgi:hypothetical protein
VLPAATAEADAQQGNDPVGSAVNIGRVLQQMYQQRLLVEVRRLQEQYPPRTHYTTFSMPAINENTGLKEMLNMSRNKPITEYWKNAASMDKLDYQCKTCKRAARPHLPKKKT